MTGVPQGSVFVSLNLDGNHKNRSLAVSMCGCWLLLFYCAWWWHLLGIQLKRSINTIRCYLWRLWCSLTDHWLLALRRNDLPKYFGFPHQPVQGDFHLQVALQPLGNKYQLVKTRDKSWDCWRRLNPPTSPLLRLTNDRGAFSPQTLARLHKIGASSVLN